MSITVGLVDYQDRQQGADLSFLLNAYALDPMGGGEALSASVQRDLASALSNVPGAFSVLCYVDGAPAGLVNCLPGFSTFKCKPLVNIHDVAVMPEFRGLGLCQRMLDCVEAQARRRGCCKVTLEVLSGNEPAQRAYLSAGFSGYELDPEMGHALFWQKEL